MTKIALAVRDPGLRADLSASFAEDPARPRAVTLDEVDAWPMWRRSLNTAARGLREQL